jgi:hypothetical protein
MPAIFEPRPKHLWMPQQTDTRQHDISARRLLGGALAKCQCFN